MGQFTCEKCQNFYTNFISSKGSTASKTQKYLRRTSWVVTRIIDKCLSIYVYIHMYIWNMHWHYASNACKIPYGRTTLWGPHGGACWGFKIQDSEENFLDPRPQALRKEVWEEDLDPRSFPSESWILNPEEVSLEGSWIQKVSPRILNLESKEVTHQKYNY